jgi:hypothetical protein
LSLGTSASIFSITILRIPLCLKFMERSTYYEALLDSVCSFTANLISTFLSLSRVIEPTRPCYQ